MAAVIGHLSEAMVQIWVSSKSSETLRSNTSLVMISVKRSLTNSYRSEDNAKTNER